MTHTTKNNVGCLRLDLSQEKNLEQAVFLCDYLQSGKTLLRPE